MTDSLWLNVAIVVAVNLIASWCWVVYFRSTNDAKPVRAALADCGILGLNMVNVVSYVEDRRLAIPVLLAAFVGTYCAVRQGKR